MSFCTSLRKRESCGHLLPVLVSPSGLSLRGIIFLPSFSTNGLAYRPLEKALGTHDVEIPISTGKSRFLIFTASNLTCSNIDHSRTRLQNFASLTGGCHGAVIFLLYSSYLPPPESHSNGVTISKHVHQQRDTGGLQGFSHLQTLLVTSNISVPLLPLLSPTSFPQLITRFIEGAQSIIHKPPIPKAVTELLPYCTSAPPMSPEAIATVTDSFLSLRDLAMFRTKQEVLERLMASGVLAEEASAVVEFWDEEFAVE